MNDLKLSKLSSLVSWIFQLSTTVVLLQNVYFKISGSAEWIFLFEVIGMEPWGRFITAGLELIAGLLLLIPYGAWLGALLGISTLSTAIFFHLTTLGVEVRGDGGSLFYLAVVVFISCVVILILRRKQMKRHLRDWFLQRVPDDADENQ